MAFQKTGFRRAVKPMASNLPIREGDRVWLTEEGVCACGGQPPKGTMLRIFHLFDIKDGEGSLEMGPPGKYAECRWEAKGNKIAYVSLDKLMAIQPGQWVQFEWDKCVYTGQLSEIHPLLIEHLKPLLNGLSEVGFGYDMLSFMSLIDEKERADVV